jgi:CHAD domain-containing protein
MAITTLCLVTSTFAPSNAISNATSFSPAPALAATGAALFALATAELANLTRSASPHDFRSSLRRVQAFAADFCDVLGVPRTLERALAKARSQFWPASSRARDAEVASQWVRAACARLAPTAPTTCRALRKFLRSAKRAALRDALRHRPALLSALGKLHSALGASARLATLPAQALRNASGIAVLARVSKVLAGAAAASRPRRLHALRITIKDLRHTLETLTGIAVRLNAGESALAPSLVARAAELQGALGTVQDAAMLERTILRHKRGRLFTSLVAAEVAEAAALVEDQVSAAIALGSDASAFGNGLLLAEFGVELVRAGDRKATSRESECCKNL